MASKIIIFFHDPQARLAETQRRRSYCIAASPRPRREQKRPQYRQSCDCIKMENKSLDCPIYSEADQTLLAFFSFWVEGVLTTIVAILGIIGNTVVSFIISNKEMRNSFNLLLVSLACFDSTYLFGSVLESFRKDFNLASETHIVMFPYFLYPVNQVAISGSIFMTVAIAWERYVAVHYPIDYNQAMNDVNAIRKRLVKYVGPSFVLALVFNIPKLFEAKVEYVQLYNETENFQAELQVAALRTHPIYSAYNNWSRLIVLGIVPFTLLVFFNTKIYEDISERRKRRLRTCRPSVSNVLTDFVTLEAGEANQMKNRSQSLMCRVKRSLSERKKPRSKHESIDMVTLPTNEESKKSCLKVASSASGLNKVEETRNVSFEAACTTTGKMNENGDPLLNGIEDVIVGQETATTAVLTLAAAAATATNSRLQLRHVQVCNERRRLFEDNLAAVCMGFVLVFLVCHFPRLLLNIHELITIKEAMMCGEQGHHPFSVWSMVTISVSHFLLVLNSSTNILVYCLLSSKFREECNKILKNRFWWCCSENRGQTLNQKINREEQLLNEPANV